LQALFITLKRKLSYDHAYTESFVRVLKVKNSLMHLLKHSSLYKGLNVFFYHKRFEFLNISQEDIIKDVNSFQTEMEQEYGDTEFSDEDRTVPHDSIIVDWPFQQLNNPNTLLSLCVKELPR